jgi:hypothetical protein
MRNAIKVLRATADDCERLARNAKASALKSELFDITATWHYLAGEAEKLHQREMEVQAGLRAEENA